MTEVMKERTFCFIMLNLFQMWYFNTIFIKLYVPENPKGTRVIVGSMNMKYYLYPTLPGIELATCSVQSACRFQLYLMYDWIPFRKIRREQTKRNDWKFAAMVIDRLCFWIFSTYLVLATMAIFISPLIVDRITAMDWLAQNSAGWKTNTPSTISIISTVQTHLRSFVLYGIPNSCAMNLSAILVQSYFYSGSV